MNVFQKVEALEGNLGVERSTNQHEAELWSDEVLIEDMDAPEERNSKIKDSSLIEDSVQMYLREIGQVALLSAAEEIALAQQIMRGKDARDRLEHKGYRAKQEYIALEREVFLGEEARRRLIQANLRLVVSVAKKYMKNTPMAFMDLVQEGNIGLMRAVEKFDYTKGNRFSTYATWWIRQAVTRSIAEQSRLIRLPVHLSESIMHLRRSVYKLEQRLEREPTPEEIAVEVGMSLRKVKRLLQASTQPVSLEQPLSSEYNNRVGEVLADEGIETPLEIATQNMLQQELTAALNELPERERKVLQLRYGLMDGRRRTLEEVGVAFGITRERTRQIEAEALRRLRHPNVGQRLQSYLE